MNYYVTIKHPITGDNIVAIPTGKIRERQSESAEVEAEVRVLTPKTNPTTLWIVREDLSTHHTELLPF